MTKEVNYCLGFAMDRWSNQVVLIRKNRPKWQAGFLNAPGGKIEPDESPRHAMSREFAEECGQEIPEYNWYPLAVLTFLRDTETMKLYVFYTRTDDAYIETKTDEPVLWYDVAQLLPARRYSVAVSNLPWLLAMISDTTPKAIPEVTYDERTKAP